MLGLSIDAQSRWFNNRIVGCLLKNSIESGGILKISIRNTFIVVNLLLLITILLNYSLHTFQKLESIMFDNNMKQTATHDPDPHIVVVAIDDRSIQELGIFPWIAPYMPPF